MQRCLCKFRFARGWLLIALLTLRLCCSNFQSTEMGSLVFKRSNLAGAVLVEGVKRPDDVLFHLILGDSQQLMHHPICLHEKLKKAKGRRTAAIRLEPSEYAVYWNGERFQFRGIDLQTGRSSFGKFSSKCFSIPLLVIPPLPSTNRLLIPFSIYSFGLRFQSDHDPYRRPNHRLCIVSSCNR